MDRFRDPAGYVFRRDARIFRAIDSATTQSLNKLEQAGVLPRWLESGKVAGTRFVTDTALATTLAAEHPPFESFLEHAAIRDLTFPTSGRSP